MAKLITSYDLAKNQKISVLNGASSYTRLKQQVTKAGILKRDYKFYSFMTLFIMGGFFIGLYYLIITPLSWQLVFWSLIFSFFTVQIGGLIHDSGHRAIFSSAKYNDLFGRFCDFLVVVGYGQWVETHNKHHSHTNKEGEDPDIELPFHAFTKERFARQNGLLKILSKYQVYFYYPIRALAAFSRRFSSISYFTQKKGAIKWVELVIWVSGVFVWTIVPFLVFPLGKAFFLIFFIHFVIGFYMSNIFAPNHKGMPQIAKGVAMSFLEHQILTTRNIYGHPITDFVFVGLNYQIEHHLFPNCPRNKLKYITPYVKEICKRFHLEFTEVSVLESNRIILRELKQIAAST